VINPQIQKDIPMKKLFAAIALIFAAFPVLAEERVATVFYPKDTCAEIISQEYSTGGGKSAFHVLEILCRDAEGNYTGLVDSWGSLTGAIGFGRIKVIERFKYVAVPGTGSLRVQL
jgi:hypothetical protein